MYFLGVSAKIIRCHNCNVTYYNSMYISFNYEISHADLVLCLGHISINEQLLVIDMIRIYNLEFIYGIYMYINIHDN